MGKKSKKKAIKKALNIIYRFGGIDGNHHKQWIIDQIVRALVDDYDKWIRKYEQGEDGPNTYEWEEGIAP